jgi:hypothetical protein
VCVLLVCGEKSGLLSLFASVAPSSPQLPPHMYAGRCIPFTNVLVYCPKCDGQTTLQVRLVVLNLSVESKEFKFNFR